jgi:hypothetical protein
MIESSSELESGISQGNGEFIRYRQCPELEFLNNLWWPGTE